MIPLLLAGCTSPDRGAPEARQGEAPGKPVPGTRFETLHGGTASLADYRGRVVVLNFWGTWCVPCRRELPELVELDRAFRERGVVVVGIAVDSGDPAGIADFAARYGVEYPIWMTDMQTAVSEFGAVGYPFTLLVDRDGSIRREYLGPQTLESLSKEIEALLG